MVIAIRYTFLREIEETKRGKNMTCLLLRHGERTEQRVHAFAIGPEIGITDP